jgi:hypothetical protein
MWSHKLVRRSRLRCLWFYALQASVFCHGDAAALFYFVAARSNATFFQAKTGIAGTTAAFLSNCHLICENLTMIEDVGVCQKCAKKQVNLSGDTADSQIYPETQQGDAWRDEISTQSYKANIGCFVSAMRAL